MEEGHSLFKGTNLSVN